MESIRELRLRLQAPRKVAGLNASWWTYNVTTRVSIYITWVLLHTSISANQVTVLMTFVGLAGGLCLAVGSVGWNILGAVLLQLSIVLDGCDGEVARYRKTTSLTGEYIDALSHYLVPGFTLFCMGFGLYRQFDDVGFLLLGGFAALCIVWIDAAYDVRIKAAYLGKKFEVIKKRAGVNIEAPSSEGEGEGEKPAPGEMEGKSQFALGRRATKFLFEPTAFINLVGGFVLLSIPVRSFPLGSFRYSPLSVLLLFYAVASPLYLLLSVMLIVRYRETEKNMRDASELFGGRYDKEG